MDEGVAWYICIAVDECLGTLDTYLTNLDSWFKLPLYPQRIPYDF